MDRVEPNRIQPEGSQIPRNAEDESPVLPVPPLEPTRSGEELLSITQEEERISIASNWTLVWWRFRKNKLSMASTVILLFLALVVLFPEFFATFDPEQTDARLAFIPIQSIHWLDEGRLRPWVPGVAGKRDPVTLKMLWVTDESQKIYLRFFAPGFSYKLFGLSDADHHLVRAFPPGRSAPG